MIKEKLTVRVGNESLEIDSARRRFLQGALAAGSGLAWAPALMAAAEGQANASAEEPAVPSGKRLKVGLIGCGSVSRPYLAGLAETEFIELVSVCDIIPERAKAAAERHKIGHFFPHVDAMLAQQAPLTASLP